MLYCDAGWGGVGEGAGEFVAVDGCACAGDGCEDDEPGRADAEVALGFVGE